jgi:hypothetical protein
MEAGSLSFLAEAPRRWASRPVWVFLVRRGFGSKTPLKAYWNSLDFLGFSRPNRDFSMGCAGKPRSVFSWRISLASAALEQGSWSLGASKAESLIGQSLTLLLIFCKKMPALIALAVVGPRIAYFSGFFVMAELDPAIHENAESCNQGNDNVT